MTKDVIGWFAKWMQRMHNAVKRIKEDKQKINLEVQKLDVDAQIAGFEVKEINVDKKIINNDDLVKI